MTRSFAKISSGLFWGASLLGAVALGLTACDAEKIAWDRGRYPDGRLAYERSYLVLGDGRRVPHGLHGAWNPDGSRKSLESFVRGAREGYSFRWDARGKLVHLAQCADDVCQDRPLPVDPGDGRLASSDP